MFIFCIIVLQKTYAVFLIPKTKKKRKLKHRRSLCTGSSLSPFFRTELAAGCRCRLWFQDIALSGDCRWVCKKTCRQEFPPINTTGASKAAQWVPLSNKKNFFNTIFSQRHFWIKVLKHHTKHCLHHIYIYHLANWGKLGMATRASFSIVVVATRCSCYPFVRRAK